MRTYLLLTPAMTEHDAVGNNIDIMAELFSSIGRCLACTDVPSNPRLKYVSEKELPALLESADTVAVYHHYTYWPRGEELLRQAVGPKLICYHGVTPPEFYTPYSAEYEELCRQGRAQTVRLATEQKKARWLCDSAFLAADVREKVAKERLTVFPPFHRTEDWADSSPSEALLRELVFDSRANLLFLGRCTPNRDLLFLMEVLRFYRENYGEDICLWLLGRQDEKLAAYNEEIAETIRRYQLEKLVRVMGEVSENTMSAFYMGCDYLVTVSGYEGFFTPIAEAQYYKMPVIVRNTAALPETAGEGGLVLRDDPREYAAAIHVLRTDEAARRWLREKGRENYDRRFSADWMKQRFRGMLKEWDMV